VLIPNGDAHAAEALLAQLHELLELNNQFHSGQPLHLSIGSAVSAPGERLEAALHRADGLMYEQKKAFHAANDRRRPGR
jgi:PleD family two-component response regulator